MFLYQDQLQMPTNVGTMSLNTAVYELMCDKSKGDSKPLFKQTNNTILCHGVHVVRRVNVTYNAILEEVKALFGDDAENLKELHVYPLMTDQLIKDKDWVSEEDVRNYTIAYGYMLEERKPNPEKPIVAPDDIEGRTKAVEDALRPYIVRIPFLLAAPEDPRYMFYISLDWTPAGAVSEWDSSKVEHAPDTDELIPSDSSVAHISPEDIELQRKVRASIEEQIEAHLVDGKLPEDFSLDSIDYEKVAQEVGLANGEDVKNFMAKFSVLTAAMHEAAPEVPHN